MCATIPSPSRWRTSRSTRRLSLVLNSNSLFAQKAGPTLFIISPNTKQKQEQYQDLMIRTFYLSSAKAKDMVALLKSMLDVKHIHGNEALNTIVIRDQPEKVELAEKIIQANDREDSEVLFDVEVLEVNRTVDQTYGLSYPETNGAALIPPGFTGAIAGDIAQQLTYRNLASLGQDSYLFKLPDQCAIGFLQAGHRCQDSGSAESARAQQQESRSEYR
jgi:general secretion pathway protein D